MIKKLQSINGFGVYENFTWKDLPNFREKNILYGWNYSGKTTLSRLFSCVRDRKINPDFDHCKFKFILEDGTEVNESNIDVCNLNILIYNSDFIKENLRWDLDNQIKGITFDVGENVQFREEIERNLILIDRIEGTNNQKGKKEKYLKDVHDFFPYEDSKFSIEAKRIKNDIFNSLIDFDKRHYVKIVAEVIENLNGYNLESEKLIFNKKISVASNDKEKISEIKFEVDFLQTIDVVHSILEKEPSVDNLNVVFSAKIEQWVKEGLFFHNEGDDCIFCGQNILEERLSTLKDYFSSEASVLRTDIISATSLLTTAIENINGLDLIYSKNDFFDFYQQQYESELNSLLDKGSKIVDYLQMLISKLHEKNTLSLFKTIKFHYINKDLITDFETALANLNDIISRHNQFIDNFETEQSNSRKTLKQHYISNYLIEEDYLKKQKKKYFALRCLTRYNEIAKILRARNIELEAQLKSITAGRKELNDFINQFLGRDDILIEISEDEKFILKRDGKVAQNFSEGEKTAISFSYFLVHLESLFRDGKLSNYIIFIDDPISSLDSNHISQIYSIINSFFFRKGIDPNDNNRIVDCFKQLFISTHNSEFFAFLKDSNRINKRKKVNQIFEPTSEYYLIKKNSKTTSEIKTLPKTLRNHKSEYLYLFELIFGFHLSQNKDHDERLILLPNAIRRFLEIYTLMKLPSSTDEVDNRLKDLFPEYKELKTLHHFSHFTNLDKVAKHDNLLMNVPQAIEELINILEKDKIHFDSLKLGCHVN